MKELLERIRKDVEKAYESLADPTHWFLGPDYLERNYKAQSGLHQKLSKRLQEEGFEIEEQTDFECDRSWWLVVRREGMKCQLRVSLAGPYADVFAGEANNPGAANEDLEAIEDSVQSIVSEFDLTIVPTEVGRERMMIGGKNKMIFSLLFKDVED